MNKRQRKKLSRRLFCSILMGDAAAVQAVLRTGISPDAPDGTGTTPLYLAAVNGEADIARLLLGAGAAPDAESSGFGAEGTPLCAAACWGHTATVRVLLAHGADPHLREDHGAGRSPVEWAAEGPHPETVTVLTAAEAATAKSARAPRNR
ncbi:MULTISPECIES: ankyrin repeat domain-containing protein [Streptomyces]|uniref:Ankyrin repeat domain-containing protein n=1 Tax=Streptomyces ramulosus TaxID=47762 RepID=A0ABW1FLE8_9ACTN